MKKRDPHIVETKRSGDDNQNIGALLEQVRGLIQTTRKSAATAINSLQVITNFEIGRRIVEYEQRGSRRAEYGERIFDELSQRLTHEVGKGFSTRNLRYMRDFYIEYRETIPQIPQTLSGKLPAKTQMRLPAD